MPIADSLGIRFEITSRPSGSARTKVNEFRVGVRDPCCAFAPTSSENGMRRIDRDLIVVLAVLAVVAIGLIGLFLL